jgi:hypothetical protein
LLFLLSRIFLRGNIILKINFKKLIFNLRDGMERGASILRGPGKGRKD